MIDDIRSKSTASGAPPSRDGTRLKQIADLLGVPINSFFGGGDGPPLFASPTGDRWVLARDATGAPVVRHIAGATSGERTSDCNVTVFLDRDRGSPQKTALLGVIESLIAAFLSGQGIGTTCE